MLLRFFYGGIFSCNGLLNEAASMSFFSWRWDSTRILLALDEQLIGIGAGASYRSFPHVGSLNLVDAHADLVDTEEPPGRKAPNREIPKYSFFR